MVSSFVSFVYADTSAISTRGYGFKQRIIRRMAIKTDGVA